MSSVARHRIVSEDKAASAESNLTCALSLRGSTRRLSSPALSDAYFGNCALCSWAELATPDVVGGDDEAEAVVAPCAAAVRRSVDALDAHNRGPDRVQYCV